MRLLHLYRPRLPGQRAQAIQVLHTCAALAARGHTVTLLADRGPDPGTAAAALAALGLPAPPTLDLRIAPARHSGLAGLWFRAQVARWWAGSPGVVLARDKRRLVAAVAAHGRRHRVVLETHELDSALAADAGRDPRPVAALERGALALSDALVANCGGTLAAWRAAHAGALPARQTVAMNATAPSRLRATASRADAVARCIGSLRAFKGLDAILAAAPRLPLPLELVGGALEELAATPPPGVRVRPPLPFPAVSDELARSRVLLLPLADNRFGRSLTNPLKLWDYLATPVPVVAPDLPTIDEIAHATGAPLHRYRPGDPASLAAAVAAAAAAPDRAPALRTWDDRAAELEALFA